jgi:hypothetical protein
VVEVRTMKSATVPREGLAVGRKFVNRSRVDASGIRGRTDAGPPDEVFAERGDCSVG